MKKITTLVLLLVALNTLASGPIVISPNPTTGPVTISITDEDKGTTVLIMDVIGSVISGPTSLQQIETVFNLRDLPAGVYLIKTIHGSEEKTFRVIKN